MLDYMCPVSGYIRIMVFYFSVYQTICILFQVISDYMYLVLGYIRLYMSCLRLFRIIIDTYDLFMLPQYI